MSEAATRRWLALTAVVLVAALAFGALSRRPTQLALVPRVSGAVRQPALAHRAGHSAAPRVSARMGTTSMRRAGRRRPHRLGRPAGLQPRPGQSGPAAVRLFHPVRDTSLAVLASPSVSAALVDAALVRERSPLAGLGGYIVARGRRWGIDPAFLLAFVSYFDARVPLPAAAHNVGRVAAVGAQPSVRGFRAYPTWQAGVDAWYRLIRELYVGRWKLRTLDSILPVYAPGSRREVEARVNAVQAMIAAWRDGAD